MYVYTYVSVYTCMNAGIMQSSCMYVSLYARTYVCVHVCKKVRKNACMYIPGIPRRSFELSSMSSTL